MKLVFLLEELSMKEFLAGFLPRVLPEQVSFQLIPHEGKSDLQKSIPRKLRGWKEPDVRFVIVQDQDSGDCQLIKQQLLERCAQGRRPDSLVRIACRELEAWFVADLASVEEAFSVRGLAARQDRRNYRAPDRLGTPSRELEQLVPGYGKVSGARTLGPVLRVDNRRSASFSCFVAGLKRLAEAR